MEEQIKQAETDIKRAWPRVMAWAGGISAIIGLFASIAGGVTWFINHHNRHSEQQAQLALAQTQAAQGDYQASIETYSDLLKADPSNISIVEKQLDTTMLWVENYLAPAGEGQNSADLSAVEIGNMIAILEAGLTRAKGSRAADIEAHLGWAHWLNQKIAAREFGNAAEQNMRAALASDPSNVYANAMLGNWTLQNGGDLTVAVRMFNTATATTKDRPLVRRMQFGGLVYLDKPGARAETVKVANDMRNSGEDLHAGFKRRIVGFCFDPVFVDQKALTESLSAVSPDQTWKTYLWLDVAPSDGPDIRTQRANHDFIQADLLEISGKTNEALEKYRALLGQLGSNGSPLERPLRAAIARLSRR